MRILNLDLATADLASQRAFYSELFNFPVVHTASDTVTFQVGASQLTFASKPNLVRAPYHFAFTIPENQFDEATQWLAQTVPLIANDAGDTTFYFDNWDAHSVYFYDPAGNIVELIARHTLPSASDRPFSGQSILGISEIGIAAEDVLSQVATITQRSGAGVYGGPASDTFAAVGDEQGLFIVVKRGRIWFPDTGKAAESLPMTVVTQEASERVTWHFV